MRPRRPHLRYANILDQSIELLNAGVSQEDILERFPDFRHRLPADLRLASWIHTQQAAFDPAAEFLHTSHARLMGEIKTLPRATPPPRIDWGAILAWFSVRRWAMQAVSILMILVLLLGSLSGVAYAAQSAIPGATLYGVKLVVEDSRLLVTFDPVSDASLYLNFADVRVGEMESLVLVGRTQYLGATILRYEYQLNAAISTLDEISLEGSQRQRQRASELADSLPAMLLEHDLRLLSLETGLPANFASQISEARRFARGLLPRVEDLTETLDQPISTPPVPTGEPVLPGILSSLTPGAPFLTPPAKSTGTPAFVPTQLPASKTPSPTATFTPTPLATATGTVTATGTATSTTAATPTNTPTGTLTLTPVPGETDTPLPSATLEPTKKPSNTPRPTITPRPTNTHRPTPLPTNPNRPTPRP
jgi:hypothetical protein